VVLTLLQRRLRASGLPEVSRDTIQKTLRGAGYSWQHTRTWCPTGTARRKRQAGIVTVTRLRSALPRPRRAVPTTEPLQQRVRALEAERNERRATIDWQFTARHDRVKLKNLYLVVKPHQDCMLG
jgi:hypothetical protein